MTETDLLTLFHPGDGRILPYPAGRIGEKACFYKAISNLSRGYFSHGDHDRLSAIGFIWRISPDDSMSIHHEPGMPGLMNHVVNESLNPDLDGRVTEKSSLKPQGIKRKSREDALDNYMPGLTGV